MKNAVSTFDQGLHDGELWMGPVGHLELVPMELWRRGLGEAELGVLARSRGPVLDVGCGPGRMAGWLAEHGVSATGLDVSPAAVSSTRARGASAVLADVLDPALTLGTFRSAILMDSNIGIGGDPALLLRRVSDLLVPGSTLIAEFAVPDVASRDEIMVLSSSHGPSAPFPWSTVSIKDARTVAHHAGLVVQESWSSEGRHFAELA